MKREISSPIKMGKKDRPLFRPGRKGRNVKETRSSSDKRSYRPVQASKEIQKRQEMLDMQIHQTSEKEMPKKQVLFL